MTITIVNFADYVLKNDSRQYFSPRLGLHKLKHNRSDPGVHLHRLHRLELPEPVAHTLRRLSPPNKHAPQHLLQVPSREPKPVHLCQHPENRRLLHAPRDRRIDAAVRGRECSQSLRKWVLPNLPAKLRPAAGPNGDSAREQIVRARFVSDARQVAANPVRRGLFVYGLRDED